MVIGFDPDSYTVNEVEGSVVLTIRVLSGMLGIPVEVQFETTPGTATSQRKKPPLPPPPSPTSSPHQTLNNTN